MASELLEKAVQNNAAWCNEVVSLHGHPGHFDADFWVVRGVVPPFYPNLITLSVSPDAKERQHQVVEELSGQELRSPWGVKDSYAALDLSAQGFTEAVDGQWLSFTPDVKAPPRATKLRFEPVSSPEALWDWEAAWRGPDIERVSGGLFRSALLEDANIVFLSGWNAGQLKCGFALNFHAGVVAISNVFASDDIDGEELVRAALHESVKSFRLAPVVTYVSNEEVAKYLSVGFSSLGPMRVWEKKGPLRAP